MKHKRRRMNHDVGDPLAGYFKLLKLHSTVYDWACPHLPAHHLCTVSTNSLLNFEACLELSLATLTLLPSSHTPLRSIQGKQSYHVYFTILSRSDSGYLTLPIGCSSRSTRWRQQLSEYIINLCVRSMGDYL